MGPSINTPCEEERAIFREHLGRGIMSIPFTSINIVEASKVVSSRCSSCATHEECACVRAGF